LFFFSFSLRLNDYNTHCICSSSPFPYDLTTTTTSETFLTMQFTNMMTFVTSLFIFTIFGAVASPVTLDTRDVFVPPILYPRAGAVWKSGETHTVVWDTKNAPVNITNKIGRIMLRKQDLTTPLILAQNFDILAGKQTVKVPLVVEGDDYNLVLFGDSGNFSPKFTIKGSGIQF